MNKPRCRGAAIWVPECGLFYVGGYNEQGGEEATVDFLCFYAKRYNKKWRFITPMLNPISRPLLAHVNKCIFALDIHSSPPQIQMFKLQYVSNGQWTYVKHNNPFDEAFEAHSMTVQNGLLLLSSTSRLFNCLSLDTCPFFLHF